VGYGRSKREGSVAAGRYRNSAITGPAIWACRVSGSEMHEAGSGFSDLFLSSRRGIPTPSGLPLYLDIPRIPIGV